MSLLIVDEPPDDLDLLKGILTAAGGWNIVTAASAADALRAMASKEISLVLADIMTPATGGL